MEQEENTLAVEEETTEPAVVEETITEETPEQPAEESTEAKLAKAQAEAAKYRRLLEKAQKPQAPQTPLNVEEAVLLANGMSEELLGELKAVAQVRKTSLIKAQADPIFVAVKEKFEREQTHKDASLGASRGAGAVKAQKTFTTPGLTRDEHKAMVMASR